MTAANPPMRMDRTPCSWRIWSIRSGRNSGSSTGQRLPALAGEAQGRSMLSHPSLGAQTKVRGRHKPVRIVARCDPRDQIETAYRDQPTDPIVGGLGGPPFEPRDRGLRRTRPFGELTLGEAGPSSRLPNDLSALHPRKDSTSAM